MKPEYPKGEASLAARLGRCGMQFAPTSRGAPQPAPLPGAWTLSSLGFLPPVHRGFADATAPGDLCLAQSAGEESHALAAALFEF